MRSPAFVVVLLGVLGLTSGFSSAAAPRETDPADQSRGKVYEWKSSDRLAYQYRIPRKYDEEIGVNLTFILHGSNLTRTWGFANHEAATFRPDDVVVCPDGTTSSGQGGFNFLGKDTDVNRFHALHEELKKIFNVNATYLYGHSQGSFFALHYAGEKPEAVQGVVAHASGVWTWTKQPEAAHHQAIVLMHGTQDPVVPYGQSVGGFEAYAAKNYPIIRMRSLEGWNHWPAEHNGPTPHTSQQFAWVEGMTTKDPKRLAAAFTTLSTAKSKEQHDFAGLYLFASRIARMPEATAGAKRVSEKAIKSVEALARKHIAKFAEVDPNGEFTIGDDAWIGHLPMFLRAFEGVPEADALKDRWAKVMEQQKATGMKDLSGYSRGLRAGDKGAAFSAGLRALKACFLTVYCTDRQFLENMDKWAGDARSLKLDRAEVSEFKALSKDHRKALTSGRKAFEAINGRASL